MVRVDAVFVLHPAAALVLFVPARAQLHHGRENALQVCTSYYIASARGEHNTTPIRRTVAAAVKQRERVASITRPAKQPRVECVIGKLTRVLLVLLISASVSASASETASAPKAD